MIERLAIIGVGLIGGSLARALAAAGMVGEVIGCGRSAENLELAFDLGVIDGCTRDPAAAVKDADMVLHLAVPLGAMRATFERIGGAARRCRGHRRWQRQGQRGGRRAAPYSARCRIGWCRGIPSPAPSAAASRHPFRSSTRTGA
jgi:hypothetical protein